MNNKGILPVVLVFAIAFSIIGAVAIWHIPTHKHTDQGITGNGGNLVKGIQTN